MGVDAARLREALGRAVRDARAGSVAVADRLCGACVDLLDVDGAALSLIMSPSTQGTYGASGPLSRRLDGLQFDLGEGPCLDSVATSRPVAAPDLAGAEDARWPMFSPAAVDLGVRAVFAFPIQVSTGFVGALDLIRTRPGPLQDDERTAGLLAAELAALPLLDLIGELEPLGTEAPDPWSELASLQQVEVYQATGMLMAQLDVDAPTALVRLRAHAFAEGSTVSEVALAVVERRLVLAQDERPTT